MSNAHLRRFRSVKPIMSGSFAHSENFHKRFYYIIFKERKRISCFKPFVAVLFFENATELFRLALLINELFEFRNFKIFTEEAEMIVKHLRKHFQNGCFILIDRAFNINVEQNCFCLITRGFIYKHKCCRIISKLVAEILNGFLTVDFFIFQDVRKHFQKVRFTTSKKA